AAYERLDCPRPTFLACPGFLRPGGGSGCYEYYEDSVEACVQAYKDAGSCRGLSPCLVTAELNEMLSTCEQPSSGEGGAGGSSGGASSAGANSGGASSAGASSGGASSGGVSSVAGSPGAGGAAGAAGQAAGSGP
ncbi:MAG TPA: hypothetical protein VNG33_02640, partial [Polyangiaceae bacterium]|nr:hypothetical protein [Polyangiaceae bacterium]